MNRKRLQVLRNVIAGIPARRFRLEETFKGDLSGEKQAPKPCGAIACMAGWAWIYPPFIRQGIRKTGDCPVAAAEQFFDTCMDDHDLFYPRNSITDDDHFSRKTDKQIALRRLDALLK